MVFDRTGADLLIEAMEKAGVQHVYALPGEENIDVMEALRSSSIEPVICRHEQHAAFMAATHGRLTGEPGICLATLGPGAMNLATGLAHASLGRFPMVAITGQKRLVDNPEGSFQKLDVTSALEPISMSAATTTHPDEIPSAFSRAWIEAITGPGACVVEIPEDVAAAEGDSRSPINPPAVPIPTAPVDLGEIVHLIDVADFPIVLAGLGSVLPATSSVLTAFVEKTGIGVVTTQMGAGAVSAASTHHLGTLGIHRDDWIHLAFDVADLIIAVGYHPTEHPASNWQDGQTVIEINQPSSVDERWYRPDHRIQASLPATLETLGDLLKVRNDHRVEKIRSIVSEGIAGEHTDSAGIDATGLVDVFADVLADDAIVAMDNTVNKIWFARRFPVRAPFGLLVDNALATMGAGLATGTVAAHLHPNRRTVVVAGDGGFMMNVQDLSTAVGLGVDLDVVVLVDDHYGFIRWEQQEQDRTPYGVGLDNPDFQKLAAAFGVDSVAVSTIPELRRALAIRPDGVRFVAVDMDQRANQILDGSQRSRARDRYATS